VDSNLLLLKQGAFKRSAEDSSHLFYNSSQ
jgi:hypothetical protein